MPRGVPNKAKKEVTPAPATRGRKKTVAVEEPVAPARRTAKKAAPAPAKKATARKSAPPAPPARATRKKAAPEPEPYERDPESGFYRGSDNHKAYAVVMAGGADRKEILANLSKVMPTKTSSGNPKNLSNVLTNTIKALLDRGFTIESSWKMNPPAPVTVKSSRRKG